jgi:hypothetical protein
MPSRSHRSWNQNLIQRVADKHLFNHGNICWTVNAVAFMGGDDHLDGDIIFQQT